jgi:hypothetical protein
MTVADFFPGGSMAGAPLLARFHTLIAGTAITLLAVDAGLAQQPSRTDGWVVIPVDDYRALRERASRSISSPDASISRCRSAG